MDPLCESIWTFLYLYVSYACATLFAVLDSSPATNCEMKTFYFCVSDLIRSWVLTSISFFSSVLQRALQGLRYLVLPAIRGPSEDLCDLRQHLRGSDWCKYLGLVAMLPSCQQQATVFYGFLGRGWPNLLIYPVCMLSLYSYLDICTEYITHFG